MSAPALRAGAPSQRRPALKGRWPPPKKKVYDEKWYYFVAKKAPRNDKHNGFDARPNSYAFSFRA